MRDPDERYTIVGPARPETPTEGDGIVLLSRSSRLLRRELIRDIVAAGFREVISVEAQQHSYTVESLTREFPQVRFILLNRELNIGSRINLAMEHATTNSVLVMWSTMETPVGLERARRQLAADRVPCVVPLLRGERGEALPTVQAPALHRKALRVLALPLRGDHVETLTPFDFVALYDRRRFLAQGGFDEEIENAFWQKLDFGFRTYLWGGHIYALSSFRMNYRSMPEPEDQTGDRGYARFYAKNLAVRLADGVGRIPTLQAFGFAVRSGLGVSRTVRLFRGARNWVRDNRERFVRDPRSVVEEWSVDHV